MVKTKTKRVPATTNNITKGIINFLNLKGHCAFRVNTTGVWDTNNKRFRKIAKDSKGVPDIIACMCPYQGMSGTHDLPGLFYGFEIKNKLTRDSTSFDQERFRARVQCSKGTLITITCMQDFTDWFKRSEFNF